MIRRLYLRAAAWFCARRGHQPGHIHAGLPITPDNHIRTVCLRCLRELR
jgi:hypothetical protein